MNEWMKDLPQQKLKSSALEKSYSPFKNLILKLYSKLLDVFVFAIIAAKHQKTAVNVNAMQVGIQ